MERRSAGGLVLAVALLSVVVLAVVNSHGRIAGDAHPAPIAAPPQIGECLLGPAPDQGGWGFGGPLYPALPVASCSGLRWGEVVSVIPRALTASTSTQTTDASGEKVTENSLQTRCGRDAITYLGGGPSGRALFPGWSWAMGTLAAVGPTAQQKAAGQSWVACVLTAPTGTSAKYPQTLKNILLAGKLPSSFATCTEAVELLDPQGPGGQLPCTSRHQVQIFGSAVLNARSAQSQLDQGCAALVRWLTRMPDPSAGGQLTVRAVATHLDLSTGAIAPGLGSNGTATCIVQTTQLRQLAGSLIGLSDGAIPWA